MIQERAITTCYKGGNEKHETPILFAKDRGLGRIMRCLSGSVLLTQHS